MMKIYQIVWTLGHDGTPSIVLHDIPQLIANRGEAGCTVESLSGVGNEVCETSDKACAPRPSAATAPSFGKELEALLNRHSIENDSNTPDFILAEYVRQCLASWNLAVAAREKWYGRKFTPGTQPIAESE